MDRTHQESFPPLQIVTPETALAATDVPSLQVELTEIDDLRALGQTWLALELRGQSSFFLSWNWIGRWLTFMAAELHPRLLKVTRGDTVVGLAVLVPRRDKKHRILPCRRWYLHETGDPQHDQLRIEYNGLLADTRFSAEVTQAALRFLAQQGLWDEVYLSGIQPESGLLSSTPQFRAVVEYQQSAHFVDLNALRVKGDNYLSALSANTRYQTRRALRDAQKLGEINLTVARDADQAMEFFADLKRLHQHYWTQKGQPGAFANPIFNRFHDDLVQQGAATGGVQLIKIAAGSHAFGYLYNLVYRDRIYNYQSGFDYRDARLKPGILSHYQAIEYSLAQGAAVYDFLGGDSQYKQSLSTHSTPLTWGALQRKGIRGLIYQAVEKVLPTLRRLRALARDAQTRLVGEARR